MSYSFVSRLCFTATAAEAEAESITDLDATVDGEVTTPSLSQITAHTSGQ